MHIFVSINFNAYGDQEVLAEFRRTMIQKYHLETRHYIYHFNENLGSDDYYVFDFNSIEEMPISLNLVKYGMSKFMMGLLTADKDGLLIEVGISEYQLSRVIQSLHIDAVSLGKVTVGEYIQALTLLKDIDYKTFGELFGEYLEDGQRLLSNLEKYGYSNGLDWCEAHWGSTHNAYDFRFESEFVHANPVCLKCEFKIDLRFPLAIFEKMAARFKNIRFEITYKYSNESGAGFFRIQDEYQDWLEYDSWDAEYAQIINNVYIPPAME